MEKKKSRLLPIALGMFFVVCLVGGMALGYIFFMPNFSEDPYYKYVERGEPNEYALLYGDETVDAAYYAVKFEDDVLINADFLIDFEIDKHIFWDNDEQTLTVTTPQKLIRMRPNEAFYTINGENTLFGDKNSALHTKDGKAFIPIIFVNEFYQINCSVSDDAKVVIVDNKLTDRTVAEVKAGTAAVRYEPDIKSVIADKVKRGAELAVYNHVKSGGGGVEFVKVRTPAGAVGYIKASDIKNQRQIPAEEKREDTAPLYEKYKGKKFTLVWDQIVGEGTTDWVSSPQRPIGIASPTWLSLADGEGGIIDKGAATYVKKAHASGYDVWPLFDNSFNADFTHEALKSTAKRQKIIDLLVETADKYGVTGINVDFESYRIEDGYYYTQFLAELGIIFRQKGLASSVDLTVPSMQNSPTDRERIGKYIDYVIVMTYDQHWASSPVSGPVAGHDWVENGISKTLEYVPKEKVVLGLPLYTRIWYTPKGGDSVTSRDFSMQRAYELFQSRNATMQWEDNTKYNKGQYEYDVDGVPTVITSWLETTETLRHKAELANKYDLAGAACWKKGLEAEGVWSMLDEVMNK